MITELLLIRDERNRLRKAVNEARPHVYRQMIKAKTHEQNATDAAEWWNIWVDSGFVENYPGEHEEKST